MAKSLFWREKVVHNVFTIILVTLMPFHGSAQSLQFKKVTYSCQSVNLETVIEDLSKATGVYFVYSSNKITTSARVTLSVKNKPLNEVLELLSKQLDLSFKINDHHVTLKSIDHPHVAHLSETIISEQVPPIIKNSAQKNTAIDHEPPVNVFASQKMIKSTQLFSSEDNIDQYLVKLQPSFHSSLLKKVPIQYVKSTAKKLNSRWFAAVGPVINNYSLGIEIQAGLQRAYVVFSPTWLPDEKFHGAFGAGTTFQFSDVLSLKPVYSYASLKKSETSGSNIARTFNAPLYQVNTAVNHHQIKLMLQYAIGKKISFRAGPTFNLSKSTFKYQPYEIGYTTFGGGTGHYGPPGTPGVSGGHLLYSNQIPKVPSDYTTNKFWIGWEASFSYRINF